MKINRQKFYTLVVVLLALISNAADNFAKDSHGKILPEIVQTGDEKFDKTFREGRELIDKEDWKNAAEKFKSIVCDCPEKNYVDAAFYWLAFTYKKQKMYAEMNSALDRLQKNFPNSSWADDARVMRMEQNVFVAATPSWNSIYLTAQTFETAFEKVPLDRDEEVKLAAFQSLLSTDAGRAVQLSDDLLKPTSKASENLKIQIVRLLASQRPFRISFTTLQPMTTVGAAKNVYTITGKTPVQTATTTNGSGSVSSSSSSSSSSLGENTFSISSSSADDSPSITKFTPQIRDILIKNYQAGSSVKLKKEIVYALGKLNDAESINYLSQLYNSEPDKELKKAVLQSFGGASFYSSSAASKTNDLRQSTFNKLLEIVKTEQDIELKTAALNSLQNTFYWSKDTEQNEFVRSFLQVYDSSDNENFKETVIRSLARYQQVEAVKKLMDIAKNDKSDHLRIAAIQSLQGSKNPEVVKFLEDLIK